MRAALFLVMLTLLPLIVRGATVFSQPSAATGGLIASSWVDPNGSDSDMYVYDDFILSANQAITEIDWRGGYIHDAMYGRVSNFSVTIFESIAGGSQPHVTNPQLPETFLAQYDVGGIAGETPAGTVGGAAMYDYKFVLPTPFQATAGVKYWVRIEASQPTYPDWGIAVGTGGDSKHFQFSTGAARFWFGGGDAAFSLLTVDGPAYTIAVSAAPDNGGTVAGGGAYPSGSTATVVAAPNPGFGFVNWTEGGVEVSTQASYAFTANANRTLVAHFTPAFTIATSVLPNIGGSTSGGGIYNLGATVTVMATPNPGYEFVNWTENGAPVSAAASYSFTANADRILVANFLSAHPTVTFDLDTGAPALSPGQGLPLDQTSGGTTAHFSPGTNSYGFSVQSDHTTYYKLSQFSGNYVEPSSLGPNILDIKFSQPMIGVTLTFCTADFQQVEIPTTIQLTAYNDTPTSPSVGAATAHGTYAGDTMPMGTLTFSSTAKPFNLVEISIPHQALGASVFLIDNIIATLAKPFPRNAAKTWMMYE